MSPSMQMIDRREHGVRKLIGELYDATEVAIDRAINCISTLDKECARDIINDDQGINELHQRVEEYCVTVIARMQPMARDLRELISDIQVAGELERIADYASSIANTVLQMKSSPVDEITEAIAMLGNNCRHMLKEVRQAYENHNSDQARDAAALDNAIDQAEKEIISRVFEFQAQSPEHFEYLTYTMWIAHSLERIGDRAVNIAERVVYIASSQNENLD